MTRISCLTLGVLLVLSRPAAPTTVIPPTFDELVARAESVFVAHVGDRDVLFVADSGRPASPLVGFMCGRFRVLRDAPSGTDMIRTHDGRPSPASTTSGI
jgi:hypothetical protein